MEKYYIWTFSELQDHLNENLKKWIIISDVIWISSIMQVDSFVSDNIIRCFLITYEKTDVPTN